MRSFYQMHKEMDKASDAYVIFRIMEEYGKDLANNRAFHHTDDHDLMQACLYRLASLRGIHWTELLGKLEPQAVKVENNVNG